jgi:hypothetical protein
LPISPVPGKLSSSEITKTKIIYSTSVIDNHVQSAFRFPNRSFGRFD